MKENKIENRIKNEILQSAKVETPAPHVPEPQTDEIYEKTANMTGIVDGSELRRQLNFTEVSSSISSAEVEEFVTPSLAFEIPSTMLVPSTTIPTGETTTTKTVARRVTVKKKTKKKKKSKHYLIL